MISLTIDGSAAFLRAELAARCPDMPARPPVKNQLLEYQALALFLLAKAYNREGARILEIGTGHGSSGVLLSKAAPLASIVSLTTSAGEQVVASRLWQETGCTNIVCRVESSWDVLARNAEPWDLIFVDGDHNRIARDLPWFNHLTIGGLLICHDYSPQDARSPSAIVYAELNAMAERLGRAFDVRVVDEDKIGMAGFYRREGETVPESPAPAEIPAPPKPPTPRPRAPSTAGLRATPPARNIGPPPRPAPLPACGLVLRGGDSRGHQRAVLCGIQAREGRDWTITWSRTLFAAPSLIPWDLVRTGFDFLAKGWDLAVPFTARYLLAQDIGTDEDRERTRAAIGDLRVPVYEPGLVFAATSAAPCLRQWEVEAAGGSDARLAFLRALAVTKPRLCVLPRIWLSDKAERDGVNGRIRR